MNDNISDDAYLNDPARLEAQNLLNQTAEIAKVAGERLGRIVKFLEKYDDEGQSGDVVRSQMANAIMGIIGGEEVA